MTEMPMRSVKYVLTTLLVLFSFFFSYSKGYDAEWNEIDMLMGSSLINSATEKLAEISGKVKANGSDQEKLRVEVYQLALDLKYCEKLPSNLQQENKHYYKGYSDENEAMENAYKRMCEVYSNFNDEVVKAIASMYMADILTCYRQNVSNKRTSIEGKRQDSDISQWSRDELQAKAVEHVKDATKQLDELIKHPIDSYYPLIKKAYDDFDFAPSVADYVVDMAAVIYDDLSYQSYMFEEETCYIYTKLHNHKEYNLVAWYCRLANLHANRGENVAVVATEIQRMDQFAELNSLVTMKREWLDQLLTLYKGTNAEAMLTAKIISFQTKYLEHDSCLVKTLEPAAQSFQAGRIGKYIRGVYAYEKEPLFSAEMNESIFSKGERLKINVGYANIDKVSIKLYRMDNDSLVAAINRDYGTIVNPVSELGCEKIDFDQSEYSLCPSFFREWQKDIIELPKT